MKSEHFFHPSAPHLGATLRILQIRPNDPRADALASLVESVGGITGLGLLHPTAIRGLCSVSRPLSQRLYDIGQLVLMAENGPRYRAWLEVCRHISRLTSVYSGAVIALGPSRVDPSFMVSFDPEEPSHLKVGSVFVRLLESRLKVRALVIKCRVRAIGDAMAFAVTLFRTASLVGMPLACTIVTAGEKTWVAEGHLGSGEFDQFLLNWTEDN